MNASIISPVSRHIVVTDVSRSIGFYKDLPGFELSHANPPELSSGAARIYLHDQAEAAGNNTQYPESKAIIFFETDDVHAMRERLSAKGMICSALQKVNWIKMEMFSVTDPDGHQLWFGKSFHLEYEIMHSGEYDGQARQIMPTFFCRNVPDAVKYYVASLGFSVNYQQHDFAVLDRDKVRVLLAHGNDQNTGSGACCIYIYNADDLYEELKGKGA